MIRNHTLTSESRIVYGRKFYRIRHADGREGGWAESLDAIHAFSEAKFYSDALIFKECRVLGGVFHGGLFHDGAFYGGEFDGGMFHGGLFYGGMFLGGLFRGGMFYGGMFHGGTFLDGMFLGGTFHGGEYYNSPSAAQRSDGYIFIAKIVDGDLRIWAGCRNFSWSEAVAHWDDEHRHGAESQRIIHFLKAQAEAEDIRDRGAA